MIYNYKSKKNKMISRLILLGNLIIFVIIGIQIFLQSDDLMNKILVGIA